MKRIHIYKLKEDLFFVPTLSVGKIYSKMIMPITKVSIKGGCSEIGDYFDITFSVSTVKKEIESGSGAFKKLIELTKVKSHKKMIATAQCIIVTYDEGIYSLVRVGGNVKYKAFMDDLGIEPIDLDAKKTSAEEIGKSIIALFDDAKLTKDVKPIV